MSNKVYKDEPRAGMYASHDKYGEVELIGKLSHDGDENVWIVNCFWEEYSNTLRIVYESDLSDFYYWG